MSRKKKQKPFIGPPAPQNLRKQLGLPKHWTEDHIKMYKDMVRGGPVGAWNTLVKYMKKKRAGDKDLPPEMIEMIIEVARRYLENKTGIDIEDALQRDLKS